MESLPSERLEQSNAFRHVGLDYLGPILCRGSQTKDYEKRWVVVFVCFVTRALHLELVEECRSEATLSAIRRFVGRRETPATILSDNTSQFQ